VNIFQTLWWSRCPGNNKTKHKSVFSTGIQASSLSKSYTHDL
jgi:hypothetical protein